MSAHFDIETFVTAFDAARSAQRLTRDDQASISYMNMDLPLSGKTSVGEALLKLAKQASGQNEYVGADTFQQSSPNAVLDLMRSPDAPSFEDLSSAVATGILLQQASRHGRSLASIWNNCVKEDQAKTVLPILEKIWSGAKDLPAFQA